MSSNGWHGNGHADHGQEERRIAMAAVAWFVSMRSDDKTPEDARRFRDWIAEDARHAEAYSSVESMWERVGGVESLPGFQAMRREALRKRPAPLRRFWQGGRPAARLPGPKPGTFRHVAVAIAAVLVLTVGGALFHVFPFGNGGREQAYRTVAGERSTVALTDGTIVTLASDTRLAVNTSEDARRIILLRGEAYFDVAHDDRRPFRVEAGNGSVTALGTEFDVRRKAGEVAVTLIDGSVEVAALTPPGADAADVRRLRPGERISYDETGLKAVTDVDIARAISWRQGRLLVENEPLLNVVDEMNRHSKRQLHVDRGDRRLKSLLVTGQFKTGRPESLVDYIRSAGIRVWVMRDSTGNITLRLRSDSSQG